MICSLAQWYISGALDKQKSIPRFLQSHFHRCSSCGEFLNFSEELERQSQNDVLSLLQCVPDSLRLKVESAPPGFVAPDKPSRKLRRLLPVLPISLASACLLAVLLIKPLQPPSPPTGMDSLFLFGRNSLSGGTIQKLASHIESPYSTEWDSLKNIALSAFQNLKVQIEFRSDPGKK